MPQKSLLNDSGAIFSHDAARTYRYSLFRRWDDGPAVNFVLLNPSTADEIANDPTVERCKRRARKWGFSAVYVTNIFAFRSTDPAGLLSVADPVGPENDGYLLNVARISQSVICGWGRRGVYLERGDHVRRLLSACDLYALRLNNDGSPGHPLYIGYGVAPFLWQGVDD